MIEDLILPHVKSLVPYSTARDEFTGSAEIYLDANENPFETDLNRYPDPHQRKLKTIVSKLRGVSDDDIFVGNGSDEAIDLMVRAVCAPGDSVVVLPPTYGMYKVAAAVNNVRLVTVPLLSEFLPDIDAIRRLGDARAKLLFLCSPNNPSGNQLSLGTIEDVLDGFPGIVVVDEAYIDFAAGPSALTLLERHDRLVVLQTLSKAWGIAGARLGFAFGHQAMIGALSRIKAPYNVNSLTQLRAIERLNQRNEVAAQVDTLVRERAALAAALNDLPFVQQVFPSQANFLLVRFDDSAKVFDHLRARGVIVRDRSSEPRCERCLRITIGTPKENLALLDYVKELV